MIHLSRDAYYCEYEDNVVFLSLSQDRYYAVDAQTVRQLRRIVSDWPRCSADEVEGEEDNPNEASISELVDAGILTTSALQGKPALPVAVDSCMDSFPIRRDDPVTCPRLRDLIAFLYSLMTVLVTLKAFGLNRVIQRMERLGAGAQEGPAPLETISKIQNLAARFFRVRVWFYTARNACLLESLVFWEFLRRNGCASKLVIGVKMKPFGAHAWVQSGDLILTDTPESVSTYRPLLVQG